MRVKAGDVFEWRSQFLTPPMIYVRVSRIRSGGRIVATCWQAREDGSFKSWTRSFDCPIPRSLIRVESIPEELELCPSCEA